MCIQCFLAHKFCTPAASTITPPVPPLPSSQFLAMSGDVKHVDSQNVGGEKLAAALGLAAAEAGSNSIGK